MFDLNEKKFGGTVIFNNGQSGVAKNVEISVEKRTADEPETYPNYRLVVSDGASKINQGFYYPKSNASKSQEQNDQGEVREVGRVMSIARATMGPDYTFPNVSSSKEAFDVLFNLVRENCGGKLYNVFTTFGTTGYPSKYLGLRYFNFIEPANVPVSRLKPAASDLMERLEQDAPVGESDMA